MFCCPLASLVVVKVNSLLLVSHYETAISHHLSRLIYPLALFLFFLMRLGVPYPPFSHWSTRKTLLESIGYLPDFACS